MTSNAYPVKVWAKTNLGDMPKYYAHARTTPCPRPTALHKFLPCRQKKIPVLLLYKYKLDAQRSLMSSHKVGQSSLNIRDIDEDGTPRELN